MLHPRPSRHADAGMTAITSLLLLIAVSGCSADRGRTTQMNPDCTQVSAEEQARGNCMYRPDVPEGL
jgi:hypothetical protein